MARKFTIIAEDYGPSDSWVRDSLNQVIRDWRADYRSDGARAEVTSVFRKGNVPAREDGGYEAANVYNVTIVAEDTGYGVESLISELTGADSNYGTTKVLMTSPEIR